MCRDTCKYGSGRDVSDLDPISNVEIEIGGASAARPAGCVDADSQGNSRCRLRLCIRHSVYSMDGGARCKHEGCNDYCEVSASQQLGQVVLRIWRGSKDAILRFADGTTTVWLVP